MGKKIVVVQDHKTSSERLIDDVGRNNVRYFDVDSFQRTYLFRDIPPDKLRKCTGVTVAVSGSDNTNWMAIAPYRVDVSGSNQEKVHDLDLMIVTLDADTNTASDTALIAYHQNFSGRTELIPGYATKTEEETVQEIRKTYTTGSAKLEDAPDQVMAGLQHMANIFRKRS